MKEKLDPRLSEILEQSNQGIAEHEKVDVLVAIGTPLSNEVRNDLAQRGLTLRTEAGTVLTGGIALADILRLAQSPNVVMIELSAPLYQENKEQFDNYFTE